MLKPLLRKLRNRITTLPPRPTKEEYLEVPHGAAVFRIAVKRRRNSRRMVLRVSGASRTISLTVPPSLPLAAAREFATKQGDWLAARLAQMPERIPFVEGAVIPVRGEDHRIVRRDGRGITRCVPGVGDIDNLPQLIVFCAPEHVARRVTDYLKGQARHDLEQAVQDYAGTIGHKVRRISLRDTRSRWGSCSSSASLNFSWRLILAPPFVLRYLAAHETAHIREMNHSTRFWALTRQLFPETDKAEYWLKKNGSRLHRYG